VERLHGGQRQPGRDIRNRKSARRGDRLRGRGAGDGKECAVDRGGDLIVRCPQREGQRLVADFLLDELLRLHLLVEIALEAPALSRAPRFVNTAMTSFVSTRISRSKVSPMTVAAVGVAADTCVAPVPADRLPAGPPSNDAFAGAAPAPAVGPLTGLGTGFGANVW